MKFSTLALSLLAIPAAFASASPEVAEPNLAARTTCTNKQIASCFVLGMDVNSNCGCNFLSIGLPKQPVNNAGWTSCLSATSLAACWDKGQSANSLCQCVGTPSTTTPSGTCKDWYKIAVCHVAGKATDSSCNCVAGTAAVPGGSSSCTDPTSMSNCFKQGSGCNSRCVCTPISSSAAPTTSVKPSTSVKSSTSVKPSTSVAPTSAAPTTSVAPGKCTDWYKIAVCHIAGKTVDGSCNCISGSTTVPGGSSSCTDPTAMSNCFGQGSGCSSRCVCVPISSSAAPSSSVAPTTSVKPSSSVAPTTSVKPSSSAAPTTSVKPSSSVAPTTSVKPSSSVASSSSAAPTTSVAPGKCNDWYAIAICHIAGKKTDSNCNCITGTTTVPGGGSDCTDPTKLSTCWKQGRGCSAKCVCEPISSSASPTTTPPSSSSSTSKSSSASSSTSRTSSAAPTTTPSGVCKDWFKIALCHIEGKKTDSNCNCITGTTTVPGGSSDCSDPTKLSTCWKQGWGCNAKCVCVPNTSTSTSSTATVTTGPSGLPRRRRDERYLKRLCRKGMTACSINDSGSMTSGYECVDTQSNIESCGGCPGEGNGQDCTAIEGVADVACVNSVCLVTSCRRGWKVVNGTECEPDHNSARFQQAVSFWQL